MSLDTLLEAAKYLETIEQNGGEFSLNRFPRRHVTRSPTHPPLLLLLLLLLPTCPLRLPPSPAAVTLLSPTRLPNLLPLFSS